MTTHNSIRSISYLLYLILFITSGCAEKTTSHAFVNETPAIADYIVYTPSAFTESLYNESTNLPVTKKISPVKSILSAETTAPVHLTTKVAPQHNTVWQRLHSLYALPQIKNDRIEREIQNFLKYPKYLTKLQKRAEPYLYFILDEIEAKQIPGELALLPAIESAFKPNAISKSKALGLWQFMPATGRLFGLKQNWWYDGRKDIYASTQAATKYLKQLGKLYDNDWPLALAAYNAGKGTVSKAIRRNKKKNLATDYWSLPLYKETMDYVPRLLAIAEIFAHPEKYNIPLLPIPNKPYFSVVETDSQLDLNLAAKMADMPLADFFSLNPAHKQIITAPNSSYRLLIHTDKVENFKDKLSRTAQKDRIRTIRHTVKMGENLGLLAKRYNTSISALRHNNQLNNNIIRKGQTLLIPSSLTTTNNTPLKSSKKLYTVKKGDTFWNIARQFAVRSKDIANWNNLSLNKALQPGQKLIIEES